MKLLQKLNLILELFRFGEPADGQGYGGLQGYHHGRRGQQARGR